MKAMHSFLLIDKGEASKTSAVTCLVEHRISNSHRAAAREGDLGAE